MNDLWEQIQGRIKRELTPTTYSIWIPSITKVLETEDVLILSTPNKHFTEHVQKNYLLDILRVLKEESNREYTIEFQEEQEHKEKEIVTQVQVPKENHINPRKNFKNFVVGSCNQFVHAIAQAVADQPGDSQYNPLFIYGPTGLGKTHLLYAIANRILNQNPRASILYITAEQFTNELISSFRYKKTQEFRDKYRLGCDVLLIDDVQFVSGKDRTQENLFHIFEALERQGKQIIFTADLLPREIVGLENRLRTRFESGIMADTQPPDIETMIAILHQKADEINITLDNEVCTYLAMGVQKNVRELEGLLNRLQALCRFHRSEPTIQFVRQQLGQVLMQEKRVIKPSDVFTAISTAFGITNADLCSRRRTRNLVRPRHICMWLIRKHTSLSFPDIGKEFGGRDHASVQYACNKITNGLTSDPDLKTTIALIERNLQV
jgi:chromosomal replication initiator protein